MTRRLAGVFVICVAGLVLGASSACAEALDGPQVSLLSISIHTLRVSLLAIDPDNSRKNVLLSSGPGDEAFLDPSSIPAWSPDGTMLAIEATRFEKGAARGALPTTGIFLADVRGREIRPAEMRPARGTAGGADPVFSPDGTTLAFMKTRELRNQKGKPGGKPRFRSSSVWVTDLSTGSLRRLTPWRNGLSISPSSFSPDGSMLAATRQVGSGPEEAIALPLAGGLPKVLARKGMNPIYSPDGSKVAYLSRGRKMPTDVFEMNADGTDSVRLTDTPKQGEVGVAWSPSGARLAFVRVGKPAKGGGLLGLRSTIVDMNADGGCEQTIFSKLKGISLGVSWRPGPGRDPGPITC